MLTPYGSPIPRYKKPAAPTRTKPNHLSANYGPAFADATAQRDINSLNAWKLAQDRTTGLKGDVALGRLDRQQGNSQANLIASLAARGMIRSGAVGFDSSQLAQDFGDRRYDITSGIGERLANITSQYLQRKQGIRDRVVNAYQRQYGENYNGLG